MTYHRVEIKKDVLLWAIKESQLPVEYIEKQEPKIHDWIKGNVKPTIKQVKKLSNCLNIPLGLFFLDEPPKDDLLSVEFRTIKNKINKQYSLNLKAIIQDMDYKKSWMSEFRMNNEYDKINLPIQLDLNDPYTVNAQKLRTLFGIDVNWMKHVRSSYDAFKFIREKIEEFGFLVMVSGFVGDNTHRTLDISEFRAFLLRDDYAPLIFINRNDTDHGLLFSLIHEFVHYLVNEEDDILLGMEVPTELERSINAITAEFILPKNIFIQLFDQDAHPLDEINRIAKAYKTSTVVVAITAQQLGLISDSLKEEVMQEAIHNVNQTQPNRNRKAVGPNYYVRKISNLGRRFTKTVIQEAESGNLLFTEAYQLLNVKGNTYDKLKEHVLYIDG